MTSVLFTFLGGSQRSGKLRLNLYLIAIYELKATPRFWRADCFPTPALPFPRGNGRLFPESHG
jgi:hypothetical protein